MRPLGELLELPLPRLVFVHGVLASVDVVEDLAALLGRDAVSLADLPEKKSISSRIRVALDNDLSTSIEVVALDQ